MREHANYIFYYLIGKRAGALYTKSPVTSLRTVFCTFISLTTSLSGLRVWWFDGSLVRWIVGSMDRWFDGSMDRWFSGSLVRWIVGSMVRWIGGSVIWWTRGRPGSVHDSACYTVESLGPNSMRSSLPILSVITSNVEVERWNKPPLDASQYILCPGASPSCVLWVSLWQSSPSYCTWPQVA